MGDGFVDEMVRIPGNAIYFNPNACFYTLSIWYPFLFTERTQKVLASLVQTEIKAGELTTRLEWLSMIPFFDEFGQEVQSYKYILRYFRGDEHYKALYDFIKQNGGGNLKRIAKKWADSHDW